MEKEESKLTQNVYLGFDFLQREVQNLSFHCLSPVSIPAAGNTKLSCCPGLTRTSFSQLFVASLNIISFSFLLPLVLWVGQNRTADILAVGVGQGDEKNRVFHDQKLSHWGLL